MVLTLFDFQIPRFLFIYSQSYDEPFEMTESRFGKDYKEILNADGLSILNLLNAYTLFLNL
jgi:hypothetical protein